jgi:hypothetical protein
MPPATKTSITSPVQVTKYKGYELLTIVNGRKTTSCKVRLPSAGVSRELGSVSAAKHWINQRDAQPMERREPFETQSASTVKGSELRCPTKSRFPGDIVGCGSANVTKPDHEGLCDCADCGIYFRANDHAGDTATEPAVIKIFEVTAAGFDGSTDETDDLVYWVASPSRREVETAIKDTGAKLCDEVPDLRPQDADYTLPAQSLNLSAVLLEHASNDRNKSRAVR